MPLLPKLLAALGIAAAAPGADATRINEPPTLVFARAEAELAIKTELLRRAFEDEPFAWAVDLGVGTITFTGATTVVTAPVQVVGTYNTKDGTFLWGWDHPSIPPARARDAALAHRFGEKHALPLFTTRKVECSEEQAWRFAATTMYLAGAQGAYRGPAGTTLVFMTYGELTITRKPTP